MNHRLPRILIADRQPVLGKGLSCLLSGQFEVLGVFTDFPTLLAAAAADPDLILTALVPPNVAGIKRIRQLREAAPGSRIIILSGPTDPRWVRSTFDAGAVGYFDKGADHDELTFGLGKVLEGLVYVSPAVAAALVEKPPPRRSELTRREQEISRAVAKGLSNKAIAAQLYVSEVTVRTHLRNIFNKLGLSNRVELALYALGAGWAQSDQDPESESS